MSRLISTETGVVISVDETLADTLGSEWQPFDEEAQKKLAAKSKRRTQSRSRTSRKQSTKAKTKAERAVVVEPAGVEAQADAAEVEPAGVEEEADAAETSSASAASDEGAESRW